MSERRFDTLFAVGILAFVYGIVLLFFKGQPPKAEDVDLFDVKKEGFV